MKMYLLHPCVLFTAPSLQNKRPVVVEAKAYVDPALVCKAERPIPLAGRWIPVTLLLQTPSGVDDEAT